MVTSDVAQLGADDAGQEQSVTADHGGVLGDDAFMELSSNRTVTAFTNIVFHNGLFG